MSNPILSLSLETIMQLSDDELVATGELVTRELDIYRRVSNSLDGEVVRRAKERKASRVFAGGIAGNVKSTPSYEWDADAVEALLKPVCTPEELAKAVKRTPPPPPAKEKVTVHTQSARAIAKKAGESVSEALEKLVKTTDGAPKVEYEVVAAPKAAVQEDVDDLPFD